MRNKRLAALVMAAIMTASSAMPVMAAVEIDGVEIESGKTIGSVKSKEDTESGAAVSVTDGDSVKVKGNVDATDTYNGGVNADNGKVEVSGNVESSEESASYAVDADNKSEVI